MFKVDKAMSRSNIPRTIRFKISFNSLVLQCCKYAICNYDNGVASDKLKDEH